MSAKEKNGTKLRAQTGNPTSAYTMGCLQLSYPVINWVVPPKKEKRALHASDLIQEKL